jgi:Domain of unknown function (DUF4396)
MVIGTALGWSEAGTIALAVVLAFFFGYSMTIVPLLRSRLALGAVVGIALAADTVSITIMEITDNAIMVAIPGAMEAGLANLLFWGSLAFSLIVAFIAAFPVNRWLIARGRGHAVVHEHHTHQVATSISAGPARAGGTGSPCGSLSPARSRLYDLLSGVAKSGTDPDLRQAIRKIRPNRRGRLASSAIVFTGPTEPPGRVSPTETLRGKSRRASAVFRTGLNRVGCGPGSSLPRSCDGARQGRMTAGGEEPPCPESRAMRASTPAG